MAEQVDCVVTTVGTLSSLKAPVQNLPTSLQAADGCVKGLRHNHCGGACLVPSACLVVGYVCGKVHQAGGAGVDLWPILAQEYVGNVKVF